MLELSLNETRVLGVLFEKERTTPDQYPLSLNGLTTGCNQKSNREPVLNLSESEVQQTLDSLVEKGLVTEVVVGSRVPKYRQRLGNTQFSYLDISLQEQSLLSVLFLRGPQTPGELRTRTNRLCEFKDVREVEEALQALTNRPGDAYVVKLPREPGKREARFAHLFSGEVTFEELENEAPQHFKQASHTNDHEERIKSLEEQVSVLQAEITDLKQLLDDLIQ